MGRMGRCRESGSGVGLDVRWLAELDTPFLGPRVIVAEFALGEVQARLRQRCRGGRAEMVLFAPDS